MLYPDRCLISIIPKPMTAVACDARREGYLWFTGVLVVLYREHSINQLPYASPLRLAYRTWT